MANTLVGSVVGSAVTFLLANVTQLLKAEAKLLGGVKEQVKILENELKFIKVFLQNTEGEQDENSTLKEVVSQIRDAAYEAEDVIDTFIINAVMHRKRSKLEKLIHFRDQSNVFHDVANDIDRINNVIARINENRGKYVTEKVESGGDAEQAERILDKRRRTVEEDHVVGFSQDTKTLVDKLVEGGSQLDVISIVGMGGLGKTTLARKIYNNNRVQDHFDVRGWFYVSQKYRIRDLLLEFLKVVKPAKSQFMILKDKLHQELFQILEANYSSNRDKLISVELFTNLKDMKEKDDEEFKEMLFQGLNRIKDSQLRDSLQSLVEKIYEKNCEDLQDFAEDELKKCLFRCLTGRRYLLVLDDIWDNNAWDEVFTSFPDKLKGSRILITSRKSEVALHAASPNKRAPVAMQMLISRCPLIEKLNLNCRIKKLPEAHQFSPNLAKLTLCMTFLEEDPMPTLEKLPNLKILRLFSVSLSDMAFSGKDMVCSKGGFPLLQYLLLENLYYLEEWRVEEGAMPSLSHLTIRSCRKLKTIPDGMRFVTTLRELEIQSMRKSFKDRLGEGGPDFDKVQHVPSLVFQNCYW